MLLDKKNLIVIIFRRHEDGLKDVVHGDRQFYRFGTSFELEDNAVQFRFRIAITPNKTVNLYSLTSKLNKLNL